MPLHVEISYKGAERSDALDEHIRGSLEATIGRFEERITRVEVHLSDENSDKEGPRDKRCLMEARPKSMAPLVADTYGEDLYAVVSDTAGKLERVLETKFRTD